MGSILTATTIWHLGTPFGTHKYQKASSYILRDEPIIAIHRVTTNVPRLP